MEVEVELEVELEVESFKGPCYSVNSQMRSSPALRERDRTLLHGS